MALPLMALGGLYVLYHRAAVAQAGAKEDVAPRTQETMAAEQQEECETLPRVGGVAFDILRHPDAQRDLKRNFRWIDRQLLAEDREPAILRPLVPIQDRKYETREELEFMAQAMRRKRQFNYKPEREAVPYSNVVPAFGMGTADNDFAMQGVRNMIQERSLQALTQDRVAQDAVAPMPRGTGDHAVEAWQVRVPAEELIARGVFGDDVDGQINVAEMEQPSGWGTRAIYRAPAVNVASALEGASHRAPRRITFAGLRAAPRMAQPADRLVLPTTLN
jgi:hypothetical protein